MSTAEVGLGLAQKVVLDLIKALWGKHTRGAVTVEFVPGEKLVKLGTLHLFPDQLALADT